MSKPSRLPSPKKVASKTPILRDVNYLNKQHNLKEDERKEAQKWLTKVIVWSVAIVAIISIVALYIMGNINQDSTPDKETQAEIQSSATAGAKPTSTSYPTVITTGTHYSVPDITGKKYVDDTDLSAHKGFQLYKPGEQKESLLSDRITRSLIQKYGDAVPTVASLSSFLIVGEDKENSAYLLYDPQKQLVFSAKETARSVEDNYYAATIGKDQDYQRWFDLFKTTHDIVDIVRDVPTELVADQRDASSLDALQAKVGGRVVLVLDPKIVPVGDQKRALEVALKLTQQVKPSKPFEIQVRWAKDLDSWYTGKAKRFKKGEPMSTTAMQERLGDLLQDKIVDIEATSTSVKIQ